MKRRQTQGVGTFDEGPWLVTGLQVNNAQTFEVEIGDTVAIDGFEDANAICESVKKHFDSNGQKCYFALG